MMTEDFALESLTVDVVFNNDKPLFGDLFLICGGKHPLFPPTRKFNLESIATFGFEQVDDYFGIRSKNEDGDDVTIWLYPMIKNLDVYHHPGPFDAVRLDYNVLRNPWSKLELFLSVIQAWQALPHTTSHYKSKQENVLERLRKDAEIIQKYWQEQGITIGSSEALEMDM
jgi:hypothetical protein